MESHTRPGSYVRILTKDEKQTYFQVSKHLYVSYVESDDVASDEEMEGLIEDETLLFDVYHQITAPINEILFRNCPESAIPVQTVANLGHVLVGLAKNGG